MKFVACVKLTPDTEQLTEVRPQDVGTGNLGVTMVMNPWDEFAVEEALSLQERYDGATAVLTVGGEESIEALTRAVAMGVERPSSCRTRPSRAATHGAPRIWPGHRQLGDYKLVLTGKQSVDGNSSMVGPGLAAEWACHSRQRREGHRLTEDSITAPYDGRGQQTATLPAVITVSIEINEPRYPNFMGIRKACGCSIRPPPRRTGLDLSRIGAEAGLVRWSNLRKPPARGGKVEFIQGSTPAEQAALLADRLIAEKVV